MAQNTPIEDTILDTAINLAEARTWESVRLYDIADTLGISLDNIRQHFREKEDLVEAWFDRADSAMLNQTTALDFDQQSSKEKFYQLITVWLDALSPHRRVTRQMIMNKLEPGHLHIQIPAVMRISRTVQWMREAAHRDATFIVRAIEETTLTGIYLATFSCWMRDDSQNSNKTRRLLTRLLDSADCINHYCLGLCGHSKKAGVSPAEIST